MSNRNFKFDYLQKSEKYSFAIAKFFYMILNGLAPIRINAKLLGINRFDSFVFWGALMDGEESSLSQLMQCYLFKIVMVYRKSIKESFSSGVLSGKVINLI